jgi:hypothetical protein
MKRLRSYCHRCDHSVETEAWPVACSGTEGRVISRGFLPKTGSQTVKSSPPSKGQSALHVAKVKQATQLRKSSESAITCV